MTQRTCETETWKCHPSGDVKGVKLASRQTQLQKHAKEEDHPRKEPTAGNQGSGRSIPLRLTKRAELHLSLPGDHNAAEVS